MEVAGQWRRQWAGTAEYGKVTEGGVTRQVARAMEVLHASAPGARVRVMRAAYHSTSGPGVPSSSYMLHSSRRVISSGFNILESPTFPSKPLEISSTPLESSPESNIETENYKVTEPDDMDISEPSKWRGTTGGNSIRMPSEESSSTDNASIIDLDPKLNHKGLYRKYSCDSENSDIHSLKRSSARASPLLDAPVTLSTLKYKSLLNSSNDWNNRRKSYSFEDTSPLNEIMVQSNDTLAMESSTDSGICKSSEIVNDYPEDTHKLKEFVGRENRFNHRDGSADNWQFKNKATSFYKGPKIKSYKEHDIVIEEPHENNIALQSTGKVTITVPITIEGADDDDKNIHCSDDADRKVKRVGFCKTELHFAAESGRVNIIATDEKPPPSNDFRKRRSAFVPINNKFEKPITLFGERNDVSEITKSDEYGISDVSDNVEFDENTAATKSILKNKIPKPKPYLLGENMAFGEIQDIREDQPCDHPVSIGVSLINKELETQRILHHKEAVKHFENVANKGFTDSLRTSNKGSSKNTNPNAEKHSPAERLYLHKETKTNNDSIRHKLSALQMSPVPKPKTRQLRESDLMFFGIDNNYHNNSFDSKKNTEHKVTRIKSDFINDAFESVRLIKQLSSSAQNSEADSDDFPDYQNVPMKNNFTPVPVPRSRVKYKKTDDEVLALKPIIEQLYDPSRATQETHRSRSRKQEEFKTITSRSRSEPAKHHRRDNILHKYSKQGHIAERCKGYTEDKARNKIIDDIKNNNYRTDADDNIHLYANLQAKDNKKEVNCIARPRARDAVSKTYDETNRVMNEGRHGVNKDSETLEKKQNSAKKNYRVQRTEKLSTPDKTNSIHKIKNNQEPQKTVSSNGSIKNSSRKKEYSNSPSQRTNKDNEPTKKTESYDIKELKVLKNEDDDINKKRQNSRDRDVNKTHHTKLIKNTDQSSTDYRIHSKELRPVYRESGEKGNNSNSRKTSGRSEYVIKYDDKNGTVSSISKVREGHSTSRQKHASKDRNRDNRKDTKIKIKNVEKSALRNAAPRSSDCEQKKRR